MKTNKVGTEPTFGFTPSRKQAKLLWKLPPRVKDYYDAKLMACPMDESKRSSNLRDRVIKEAINLAKRICGKR